jgi:hypothetical protein
VNESSTSKASTPAPDRPPGTLGMSIAMPSRAFWPAEARLSVASRVASSVPVFSNVVSIVTLPP